MPVFSVDWDRSLWLARVVADSDCCLSRQQRCALWRDVSAHRQRCRLLFREQKLAHLLFQKGTM